MVIEKCQENHDALVCEWIDILLKIYLEKYEAGVLWALGCKNPHSFSVVSMSGYRPKNKELYDKLNTFFWFNKKKSF